MIEEKIDNIIARSLSDQASLEELLLLDDWLNEDEKNRETFLKIKAYCSHREEENYSVLMSLSAKKLQEKIKFTDRRRKQRQLFSYIASAAATIALLFVGSFFMQEKSDASLEYYTHISSEQVTDFELPDGTKIYLNKNSELSFSSEYGENSRTVSLKGEAFFEVEKDSLTPFIVDLKGASITVIGTSFNLSISRDEQEIKATLLDGSICFNYKEEQILLKPDEQLIYSRTTNDLCVRVVDAELYCSWKEKMIKYSSVSIVQLMAALEQHFGVVIKIKNYKELDAETRISGAFLKEQSIDQVLQVISNSLPIEWENVNGIYQITIMN